MARLIDADALFRQVSKNLGSTTMYLPIDFQEEIVDAPTIDAIPVAWLCEKIREEDKFGGIPFGEYLKVLIWEWHQQEDEEQEAR
jgi:hypothetical protein